MINRFFISTSKNQKITHDFIKPHRFRCDATYCLKENFPFDTALPICDLSIHEIIKINEIIMPLINKNDSGSASRAQPVAESRENGRPAAMAAAPWSHVKAGRLDPPNRMEDAMTPEIEVGSFYDLPAHLTLQHPPRPATPWAGSIP